MLKIAIDVDDVLLDNTNSFIEYLKTKEFQVKFNDFKSRRIWEILGIKKDESDEVINDYIRSEFFANMPIVSGAPEAVKNLSNKYQLYIVTARPAFLEPLTKRSLEKNFDVSFADMYFVNQPQFEKDAKSEKKEVIEAQIKADYFIEDDIAIVEQLDSNLVKSILLAYPWNESSRFARFDNWGEISKYILKK